MRPVKKGDRVKVHYTGKLADGTIFENSRQGEPLLFQTGEGKIIPGFEQAIIGMAAGEIKTVKLDHSEAYGPYHPELVIEVERSELPPDVELMVGHQVEFQLRKDQTALATITRVSDSKVTLDANHPLAGKEVIFEIELLGIEAFSR
jgi:FKBP-type peptidyl-prolyl cis-trans isomerase 2